MSPPYGMELLATVHWVMTRGELDADDPGAVLAAVQAWSPRKRSLMKPSHINTAWRALHERGWVPSPAQPNTLAAVTRQALVELDALAALSLDERLLLYRVQFPVLRQNEAETFYDRRGKIVFTVNRGLSGVGLSRKQWQEIQDAQPDDGDALPEWAHDAQGRFEPPFDRCEREADMSQAYVYFQRALEL